MCSSDLKARALLAEAGYPKGFSFKTQVCSCNPDHMDLIPLLAAYLEKVGVKMEIQTMEYGAYLSAMTTKTNAAGYFLQAGLTNPTISLTLIWRTRSSGSAYTAAIFLSNSGSLCCDGFQVCLVTKVLRSEVVGLVSPACRK